MVFYRLNWIPAVLGVALALGILPSTAKADSGIITSGTATRVGDSTKDGAQVNIHGTISLDEQSIGNGNLCTFTLKKLLYGPFPAPPLLPQELVCATPGVNPDGTCSEPLPDRIDTIPPKPTKDTPPDKIQRKRACKGDDNDVTCKDDNRPSLSIKFKQKSDGVLEFDLRVDHAVIPHTKDEIGFPTDLTTAFQLDCPGGTFGFDANASWCVTSKPDSKNQNIRTPLSGYCQ